jgi:hypothetical protein
VDKLWGESQPAFHPSTRKNPWIRVPFGPFTFVPILPTRKSFVDRKLRYEFAIRIGRMRQGRRCVKG